MHLNKELHEKDQHMPKAIQVIHLGFTSDLNTSGYKFLVDGTGKILVSNQGKFDEDLFPYHNRKMIDNHIDNLMSVDNLTTEPEHYQFVQFGPDINLNKFEKICSGESSDSYILSSLANPNICVRVKREELFVLFCKSDQMSY